MNVTNF